MALGFPGEVQFQSPPSAAQQELHELACLLGPAPAHLDPDLYERALLFSSSLRVGLAPIHPPSAPALIGPCPSGHLYLRPLTLAWPSQRGPSTILGLFWGYRWPPYSA